MNVQLHSTDKVVTLNGVPARIWEGITENGIEVHAFITRIAVHKDNDASQFEKELSEQHAPASDDIQAYPSRLII